MVTMITSEFHIAMFPWFAMGHITPYLLLSNKLAERGNKISFFIPAKTQSKFNHFNLHPHLINFIPLTISQINGLPLGAETVADVAEMNKTYLIAQALDLTQEQVQNALEKLKPDFIFYDFPYWVPTISRPLGIKSIYFCPSGAQPNVALVPSMMPILEKGRDQCTDQELHVLTKIPEIYPGSSTVKPPSYQTKGTARTSFDGRISVLKRIFIAMKESDALCFRACNETECTYAEFLENQYDKPVLLTGPLLYKPCCSSSTTLEERWSKWLDSFEKGSVVYCAFGSECVLEKEPFQELVLGLEQTGLPFLVRLRPPVGFDTVEEALPEGFEERVRGRGVVHGGWIQQQLILSHPSVGCFVGHCGSGSMWESLVSTCQLVLVPHFADQFINTNFLTKRLKVAVDVDRREEDGWFKREDMCKAVKLVMDEGSEVGEEIRANHHKLSQLFLGEGFETSYINNFILKLQDFLV